jgi:hypothetical protein
MICADVRRLVPGYLDGALPERLGQDAHARMGQHLEDCRECRAELERYGQLSAMMSSMGATPPPAELGLEIRMAVAQARATQGLRGRINQWKNRMHLVIENILEPLAVPATGGLLAALVVFAIIAHQFLGIGMPLVAGEDLPLPTSLLQPARLETLAGLQMSGLTATTLAGEHAVLVEATVSAAGEAVSYRVISGDVNRAMQRELDQVLLLSRFRPQLSFGRPLSGGRVILSFNTISVRG